MPTKICICCKEILEVSKKYFYVQSRNLDKLRSECKTCFNKKYHPNFKPIIKNKKTRKEINRLVYLKRKNDPIKKLKYLSRTRVNLALKNGFYKQDKTFNLIGCSPSFLKTYLEKLFHPGMNWENHSRFGWHIDHIKPCSSFNLNLIEEQKKCFHYTNLQPLWWRDNLSKSDNL